MSSPAGTSDPNELNAVNGIFDGQGRLKSVGNKRGSENSSADTTDKKPKPMAPVIKNGQKFCVLIPHAFTYDDRINDDVVVVEGEVVGKGKEVFAIGDAPEDAQAIKVAYRPDSNKDWCSKTCHVLTMPLTSLEMNAGEILTEEFPHWDPTVVGGQKPAASESRTRDEPAANGDAVPNASGGIGCSCTSA